MLSIVGNIKINDATRLKYLKATLWSFELINDCQLLLNVDCNIETFTDITNEVRKVGFKNFEISNQSGNYGEIYCELLDKVNSEFVCNFFEDFFILLDNRDKLKVLLKAMQTDKIDVIKSGFWQIEKNSSKEILGHYDVSIGLSYVNNKTNHNLNQKYYGTRYFLGCNFITTLEFAKKFWSRKFDSKTPHKWEIAKYDSEFECKVLIPNIEISCSVDDAHGCEESNLLARPNEKKFWEIYNKV